MARSIVLRFDAQCVDCGRSLPAGSTARWFGRGRVSCCGAGAPGQVTARDVFPNAPLVPPGTPVLDVKPPGDSAAIYRAALDAVSRAPHRDVPPYLPSPELGQLARDTGISVEALASGLSPKDVETLATKTPNQRLLVRLSSGARFIVPALHAAHVLRCISESCVDRVRDVALLAESRP